MQFFPQRSELTGKHSSHDSVSELAENPDRPTERAPALIDWPRLSVAIIFTALLPDGASQHWCTTCAPTLCEQMEHEETGGVTWSKGAKINKYI